MMKIVKKNRFDTHTDCLTEKFVSLEKLKNLMRQKYYFFSRNDLRFARSEPLLSTHRLSLIGPNPHLDQETADIPFDKS